tara:strand:- start:395 stop:694 length:300 start_codon:yes stop_codon:yes gene_type:complete
MPTYTFYDTVTQEEYDVSMKISELDDYKKLNPQCNQVYTPIAIAGDHLMNSGPKVDGGFQESMQRIASAHPDSPLADRYGSGKTSKQIKTKEILKKHMK